MPSLARRLISYLIEVADESEETRDREGLGVEEIMAAMSGLGGERGGDDGGAGKGKVRGWLGGRIGSGSCSVSDEPAVAARMSRMSMEEMDSLAGWCLWRRVRDGLAEGLGNSVSKSGSRSMLRPRRMSPLSSGYRFSLTRGLWGGEKVDGGRLRWESWDVRESLEAR